MPEPKMRICRHVLTITPHAPAWLDCATCQACFLHRADCPGLGTPTCAEKCMNGADPEVAALDALYAQPAFEEQPHA